VLLEAGAERKRRSRENSISEKEGPLPGVSGMRSKKGSRRVGSGVNGQGHLVQKVMQAEKRICRREGGLGGTTGKLSILEIRYGGGGRLSKEHTYEEKRTVSLFI